MKIKLNYSNFILIVTLFYDATLKWMLRLLLYLHKSYSCFILICYQKHFWPDSAIWFCSKSFIIGYTAEWFHGSHCFLFKNCLMAGWNRTHCSAGLLRKTGSLCSLLGTAILFVAAAQTLNLFHFVSIYLWSLESFSSRFVVTVSKNLIPNLRSSAIQSS